jgi:hypothetical protein
MSKQHVDKLLKELPPEELRRAAGYAIQGWGAVLANRLSVSDSWRLLLAGALSVMQAELTQAEISTALRQAADRIDSGELENTSH